MPNLETMWIRALPLRSAGDDEVVGAPPQYTIGQEVKVYSVQPDEDGDILVEDVGYVDARCLSLLPTRVMEGLRAVDEDDEPSFLIGEEPLFTEGDVRMLFKQGNMSGREVQFSLFTLHGIRAVRRRVEEENAKDEQA